MTTHVLSDGEAWSYEPLTAEAAAAVEKDWTELWEPLLCPNGVVDLERVKRELSDYRHVMHNASEVYMHVTGGRISKVNTIARHVIGEADAVAQEECRQMAAAGLEEAAEASMPGSILVHAVDPTTDEESQYFAVSPGDYHLITCSPCYLEYTQLHRNGTVVITLKGHLAHGEDAS